jgi:dolichol kinase
VKLPRQRIGFTGEVTLTALPVATLELSSELYALLRKIDPSSFRDEHEAEAKAQLAGITARVQSLCEAAAADSSGGIDPGLSTQLAQLRTAIHRAQDHKVTPARAFWAAFQREVHPAYESLAALLRGAALPAPSLRPTNYARSLFHVCSALVAVLTIALVPSPRWLVGAAGLFFGFAWSMEVARRIRPQINDRLMAFFGKVAHAHERHRVNSSTWYATALLALSLFCHPAVSAISVAVLGIGDPVAALIGRRFGRIRLVAGRSLEGSLAFVVSGSLAAFAVATVLLPGALPARVIAAVVAGVVGAIAEVFSTHLDDNLSIPLAVATAVTLTLSLPLS